MPTGNGRAVRYVVAGEKAGDMQWNVRADRDEPPRHVTHLIHPFMIPQYKSLTLENRTNIPLNLKKRLSDKLTGVFPVMWMGSVKEGVSDSAQLGILCVGDRLQPLVGTVFPRYFQGQM